MSARADVCHLANIHRSGAAAQGLLSHRPEILKFRGIPEGHWMEQLIRTKKHSEFETGKDIPTQNERAWHKVKSLSQAVQTLSLVKGRVPGSRPSYVA